MRNDLRIVGEILLDLGEFLEGHSAGCLPGLMESAGRLRHESLRQVVSGALDALRCEGEAAAGKMEAVLPFTAAADG